MQIFYKVDKKAVYVSICGDIDMFSIKVFRRSFIDLLEHVVARKLILDFGQVRYLDSSGLATLVQFVKYHKERNVKVSINRLTRHVYNVLKLAGLCKFLLEDIYEIADN